MKYDFVVKSSLIHLLELRLIYSQTTQNNIQYQIISLFLCLDLSRFVYPRPWTPKRNSK